MVTPRQSCSTLKRFEAMKIEITDKEIKVTWLGETRVCVFHELAERIRNAPVSPFDNARKRIIINFWDSGFFKRVDVQKPKQQRKVSTLDVLEGCARQVSKFSDYDFGEDIDDLLGADPYLPLY